MNISYTEFESTKHAAYSQREIPVTKERETNDDLEVVPLNDPFERIALCLSGGGYRAAAFSLGTMIYLHNISFAGRRLLERVSLISSTSGGSITALAYGYHLANNHDFHLFSETLKAQLQGEDIVEKSLTILNDNKQWKGNKKRTLINAFAKTYDELLFKSAPIGLLAKLRPRLKICINATEFYRGLTFRFQNYGFIGNKFINLEKHQTATTDKIKIADVLAASSCFPVGFEPIEFPRDFSHPNLHEEDLRAATSVLDYNNEPIKVNSISLMDGGVTDNQGLHSAMLTDLNARKSNEKPISLFIVTDVASYFMDHYDVPEERTNNVGRFSLSGLYLFAIVAAAIAFVVSVYLLGEHDGPLKKYIGALLFFPAVSFLLWFVYDLISNLFRIIFLKKTKGFGVLKSVFQIKNFSDEILNKLYHYLRKLSLSTLEQMIKNRLSSAVTMVSDINLKHVRRLINDLFYSNELFEDRRCTNYIYEYSAQNLASKVSRINDRRNWNERDKDFMRPSTAMTEIAEEARQMGTTLWFDSKDQKSEKLKKLIATGEFTVCGSLLEYILDLKGNTGSWARIDEDKKQAVESLETLLRNHWEKFKRDPLESNYT